MRTHSGFADADVAGQNGSTIRLYQRTGQNRVDYVVRDSRNPKRVYLEKGLEGLLSKIHGGDQIAEGKQ